jgi:hypothetical protein
LSNNGVAYSSKKELNMANIKEYWVYTGLLGILLLGACTPAATAIPLKTPTTVEQPVPTKTIQIAAEENRVAAPTATEILTLPVEKDATDASEALDTTLVFQADVVSVSVSGEPGAYSFSVTVSSSDKGCDQYADWWEVISQDGELIYRRILLHSHVNEQPFTRSGGPVPIETDTIVVVRAHMHQAGYGSLGMKGSPKQGFEQIELKYDFAADLEQTPPLPASCDF